MTQSAGPDLHRTLLALIARLQERDELQRAQLARQLHDDLGGLLAAACMEISRLQDLAAAVGEQTLPAGIALVQRQLVEAIDMTRRLVEQLQPGLLQHFGIALALQSRFEEVCRGAGLKLAARLPAEAPEIGAAASVALYRVADEALGNVVMHARASHVQLVLEHACGYCRLMIEDDGVGMDVSDISVATGLGLAAQRHRLARFGGSVSLRSTPGRGTVVTATVPVAGEPLGVL